MNFKSYRRDCFLSLAIGMSKLKLQEINLATWKIKLHFHNSRSISIKKGLPEILVKAVMSLYAGSKPKVKVGSKFTKEFYVAVGVHQGSILSPLLFTIVVDVVTENANKGLTWY